MFVELCEDIRIDTVQLANLGVFSSVFKDFMVGVVEMYITEPEGWTVVPGEELCAAWSLLSG